MPRLTELVVTLVSICVKHACPSSRGPVLRMLNPPCVAYNVRKRIIYQQLASSNITGNSTVLLPFCCNTPASEQDEAGAGDIEHMNK